MHALESFMKKLRLTAFTTAVAIVFMASTALVVNASWIYCLQNCSGGYGETFWLSCGSSAGNYFALCPAEGGACTVDQGTAQQEADYECAQRGH
jgi:uncharacterized membrane protein YphA (DoxX/SURF4 family)